MCCVQYLQSHMEGPTLGLAEDVELVDGDLDGHVHLHEAIGRRPPVGKGHTIPTWRGVSTHLVGPVTFFGNLLITNYILKLTNPGGGIASNFFPAKKLRDKRSWCRSGTGSFL